MNISGYYISPEDWITVTGHFNINTVGSSWGNPAPTGAGFSGRLGDTTSLSAELWAIYGGLEAAANGTINHSCGSPIDDCRRLVKSIGVEAVRHVPRQGNASADILAKAGVTQEQDFVLYNTPPDCISLALLADVVGVVHPRTHTSYWGYISS
ncbi:Uncharacterized protein TCM_002608 [Theobroma cacao]|uniref:RNase H type-1 domain-containing protein n=1 Tax=Theobroma cacao TaxID=3641 RepID=A0A061DLP9_THECC|nr:Uncharacterized protein TCM_002608 [Theobroma cacao]